MIKNNFYNEFIFTAVRSSGKGGQNVNKVSSKIELTFDVLNSSLLNDEEKNIILIKLSKRINKDGVLRITEQSDRSQFVNKGNAIKRFYELMEKAFKKEKKRKKTKPTKISKEKRLISKKIISEKKSLRNKFIQDDN